MPKSPHEYIIEPFSNHRVLLLDGTQESLDQTIRREGIPPHIAPAFCESGARATEVVNNTDRVTYFLQFSPVSWDKSDDSQCAGMVAHECCHVVDWLFENIGETHPGMETRAYLIQSLVQWVLHKLTIDRAKPTAIKPAHTKKARVPAKET